MSRSPRPEPKELQQSLSRLHSELARTPRVDEASRRLLREVLADIERLLGRETPGAAPAASAPPIEAAPRRLEALAVEFESEHPALAGSLRQFIDLLGRAGL